MSDTRTISAYLVRAEEDRPVVWLASSPEKARDGLSIPVDAWNTDAFEKQGSPLMWAHQYDEPPIGRVTRLTKTDAGLIAETTFSNITQRARETEALVREGTLNCCSVGFSIDELKGETVTRASLTELSVVPIGADVNAVALARSLYPVTPETPATPIDAESLSWEDAADQMVRLHLRRRRRPDAEWDAEYRRLCRDYERLDKTPPELIEWERLADFEPSELRGLFLEGEADLYPHLLRAGAVLSTRNKSDLETAMGLIAGVIERASKEPATPETPEEPSEPRAVNPTLAQLHALITKKAS